MHRHNAIEYLVKRRASLKSPKISRNSVEVSSFNGSATYIHSLECCYEGFEQPENFRNCLSVLTIRKNLSDLLRGLNNLSGLTVERERFLFYRNWCSQRIGANQIWQLDLPPGIRVLKNAIDSPDVRPGEIGG